MAEGLVYTSVLLTPHIAPMVNEIFLNIKDSSQHPYPLPIILSSLFFIGLANISLDCLRVTAGLARLNQQHIAQTNIGILDDFIARIAGSMIVDSRDEKMRVPHDRLIREALVAAGITPEMARLSEYIYFGTEHAHAAAVNMQEALNSVPSSSRERLYPDEQKILYEKVVKAAQGMVPLLKRAARDYHTRF
jgi:hypothetical protein